MKLLIFSTVVFLVNFAHANTSGQYRVVSATHNAGGGVTRCVAFIGSNVFGAIGDVLNVSFDNASFNISETTSFPEGISLPLGNVDVKPSGCCGGDHLVFKGQLTSNGGTFAIVNLSAGGWTQSIQVDTFTPNEIVITDSFPQMTPSVCHLEKVR